MLFQELNVNFNYFEPSPSYMNSTQPDLVFTLDISGRILTYYTDDVSKLYSPPKAFIGQEIERVFNPDQAAQFRQIHNTCLEKREKIVFEYELTIERNLRHFYGEYIPCKDQDNSILHFLVFIRDISELKKLEQEKQELEARYKNIFEYSKSGIIYGSDWRVVDCNQAYCDILEIDAGELKKLNISTFTHPEDRARELESWQDLMDSKKDFYRINKRYITAKGNIKWVNATISVLREEDGSPKYFMGVVNEITDEVLMREQLEKEIQSKDRLFSIIGHDLRAHIGNISSLSEILLDSEHDEETKSILELSHSSANSALRLLENLLEWGKAQTDGNQVILQSIAVDKCIQESMLQVRDMAKMKNIVMEMDCEPSLQVNADSNMFDTMLRNLLQNAIKFSYPNSTVKMKAFKKQGTTQIEVIDAGVGMSEEQRNKLFRLDNNLVQKGTQNETGYGLGLLICKEFMEKLGGSIEVESAPDKGSLFRLVFPD